MPSRLRQYLRTQRSIQHRDENARGNHRDIFVPTQILPAKFWPLTDYPSLMKLTEFGAPIVVALALHFSSVSAKNSHRHLNTLERKHLHLHRDVHISKAERDETGEARDVSAIVKRGGQCQFPTDAGLVSVAPNAMNAGWAMSPDQPCTPNSYCPYACPPGQMMAQWDPQATSYPSMVCEPQC